MEYVDVCRALGIILVVFGHTYYGPEALHTLIYSFHMPLFFILSGFVFDRDRNEALGFRAFAKKKVKTLLIPYALFGAANLVIQIIWKRFLLRETVGLRYILDNIVGILLCYSSKEHMPNCSPIWFLLCLFIAEIIFFFVVKFKKGPALGTALGCMTCCWLISLYYNGYTAFPWKFPVFLMAVFFLYVGYGLRKCCFEGQRSDDAAPTVVCLIAAVLAVALELLTGNQVGMNENSYGNILVFLCTSVTIPAALLMLCKRVPMLGRSRLLVSLGRKTIYVAGFNYLCRDMATEIWYLMPFLKSRRISFLPLFLITALLCWLCILACDRISAGFTHRQAERAGDS